MKYQTKKIGLFLSHSFGRYQSELCQGIVDRAKEYGYRVEIYSSTDGEDVGGYGIGEESILEIPDYSHLHGVIFASGTYLSSAVRKKLTDKLQRSCSCPILEICNENNTFPQLCLDNNSVFQMVTVHFLTVHKKKRICYLGSSDHPTLSLLRQNAYQEALRAHGKIDKKMVISCKENPDAIQETVKKLIAQPSELPDAILCYNDRMALNLICCLLKAGIKVPEDIAVSGCDDLPFGRESDPQLTTISFPIRELGSTSVDLLRSAFSGESLPSVTELKAVPIYRSSCGCPRENDAFSFFLPARLSAKIDVLESSMIHDIRMSADLHRVTDLDMGIDLLENYIQRIDNLSEFYLCLYPDWDSTYGDIRKLTEPDLEKSDSSPDTMLLKFAYRNGKRLPECSFVRQNPLPEYLYSHSNTHYLFQSLYFGDKAFGYLAIGYEKDQIHYPFPLISWLRNINSMLENICHARHMGLLVERLDALYNYDELTGLYNRRSFFARVSAALSDAVQKNRQVLSMRIDIDSLGKINEAFGHEEGNFAIRVVGHAIENAASPQNICGRTGGDSFYIFASESSEKEAVNLQEHIDRYLENYNRLHTRKYLISVTSSFTLANASNVKNLDSLFHASDQKIYEEKRRKSLNIINP